MLDSFVSLIKIYFEYFLNMKSCLVLYFNS